MQRTIARAALLALTVAAAASVAAPAVAAGDVPATGAIAHAIGACIARATAHVDDPPPPDRACSDRAIAACDKTGNETTVAMVDCTGAAVRYWEGVVANRTRALRARRQPALTAFVDASDVEWKRYRTSRCSMYALFQGTIWGPVSSGCALDVTVQRAIDLADLAQNYAPAP